MRGNERLPSAPAPASRRACVLSSGAGGVKHHVDGVGVPRKQIYSVIPNVFLYLWNRGDLSQISKETSQGPDTGSPSRLE